jgi:hypothetical protein
MVTTVHELVADGEKVSVLGVPETSDVACSQEMRFNKGE